MALEEWCFSELSRGRPVDELIRQIVERNECIAVLGVAAMLALHTETVSEATLPLFASQRLIAADFYRWGQDISASTASLIGFTHRTDKAHIETIQAANSRPVRKSQLSWMVPRFVLAAGPFGDRVRKALLNFRNDLPYQYEEHRDHPGVREYLTAQALEYAELADVNNYQAYRTKEDSNQIAIVHVSPSAAKPENVDRAEEAVKELRRAGLWTWAAKTFEEGAVQDAYKVGDAIKIAKEADSSDLFIHSEDENERVDLRMRRGAVAATAAVVLNFRDARTREDLEWARGVLGRAFRLPERPDLMWSPSSFIPWHQGIYVARGLAADLRESTAPFGTSRDLLGLIAHPLDLVSMAAIEECCKLWPKDPKLAWSGLLLAFSLCHVPSRSGDQLPENCEVLHSSSDAQAAVDRAIAFYENESGWASLPLPPPAWMKVEQGKVRRSQQGYEDYDADDATDAANAWAEPDVFWRSKQAAEILKRIPLTEVMNSSAKGVLLDFLAGVLDWTNQKNAPPWAELGRRDRSATRILEWTHMLGSRLGHVAGLVPLADFRTRFLNSILGLEGENCWALLSPFASTYVCAYVYDAPVVPADAVATLDLCLGRLLDSSSFKRGAYRSGEFSGFDQPELVRILMFVSVERADLATRYVNGNWSEIGRILPLIDRFVRAGGWAATVMDPFLTLCERAMANYPGDAFADQVLSIIGDGPGNLKGWRGTFIPARVAELVQHFAHRNAPMTLALAQKFLRILDLLVDMGDRRSAALQLSEAFREVRLRS